MNDLLRANIEIQLERDRWDRRVTAMTNVTLASGRKIAFLRSSEWFTPLPEKELDEMIADVISHLFCVVGRKLKAELNHIQVEKSHG